MDYIGIHTPVMVVLSYATRFDFKNMKALIWLSMLVLILHMQFHRTKSSNMHGADLEDNDFAEFEEFDDEDTVVQQPREEKQKQPRAEPVKKVVMAPEAAENEVEIAEDDDATVEEDEDEFEHFQDDEEFEGFDKEKTVKGKGPEKPPDLKITKVPLHLRTNWDSFYMEMLMLAGLGVYFLNFLAGKAKNNKLAQAWKSYHKELLEANFSLVGDDGTSADPQRDVLMKESENIYSLWCSGRVCVEGMLVTLKLLKRQDLVSTISRFLRPASDQIIVKVTLEPTEMENVVFCVANKKVCSKLQKEMNDLTLFCTDRKSGEKYNVPSSFQVLCEIPEASTIILDSKVAACLKKYEQDIEYMHFSDQFSGPKQQDENQTTKPETEKVLIFAFNVPGQGSCSPKDMADMKPLMQLVFYCIDKMKRMRLSKEARSKADRNRQKVEDQFQKATHAQRSEAAQLRKEEKRRAEKDKIMNEDDPERQRKLEERNQKKEMKKKQPKVKMMKIKAM